MAALDTVDRDRAAWWGVAVLLAAALAYTVYSFAGTVVFGFFIYYATRPVYRRLRRWVRPPSVAAAVALLTLALPALLLAAYTTAVGLQELDAILTDPDVSLGRIEALLGPYIDVSSTVQDPQSLLEEPSVQAALSTVADDASAYLGFLWNVFIHLFAMLTIAFYLLRDDTRLAKWFHRRFADGDGVLKAYTDAVDRDFSNIFFGNILFAFITGIVAAVAYNGFGAVAPAGLGVPYPTLLGLLTGVASLVPVIGIKLVWIPVLGWLGLAAAQQDGGWLFVGAFGVVAAVVVDFIPDLVVRPYVSGRDLHLGLVMLAYVFGPLIWGWYGIFLGPMVLVLLVHFVRLVLPELVAGEAIEPVPRGSDVQTAERLDADGERASTDAEPSARPANQNPDEPAAGDDPLDEQRDERSPQSSETTDGSNPGDGGEPTDD
jgi:predicted PurR-regulated permease PerM